MQPRLKKQYDDEIRAKLMADYGINNVMAAPKLLKIVVNMGVKGAVENKALVEMAAKDLGLITGQRPTIRLARRSIAGFKLRQGMPIGCAVTLRGNHMWEFADRLISLVLPRIRDFRGVGTNLDGRGNYTLGLSDQTVFPEIELDKVQHHQGMDITFVTNAANDEQATALLTEFGMPFRRPEAISA
ncbi:50S ribosomal protein L5 [Engelhardtia mirabilis]|uniref:Large ribosomal subunit protein uL5 n=1 Tax=Engelhardtia mirabilis TaxID=2528011 RepID=A0A518BPC5_9BACT|nr:50S ribosomal protein L5 [Planctomycetes bacterium Pla133]QDV03154.1 50S ribosomal protein L5 [Planctomycetes bacterium Pla86]